MRHRRVRLFALLLALVGYWSPWLTHPIAALRLNGYELSEWVTFLPGVRDGSLPLSRLLLLLPLACLSLLFGLVASRVPPALSLVPFGSAPRLPEAPRRGLAAALPRLVPGWGWPLVLIGAVCALVIFPPYPYLLTAYADREYQGQLFVAAATLVGLLVTLYLPVDLKDALQTLLGLAGAGLAAWGMLNVRPAASALLNSPWPIGLGLAALLFGFVVLGLGGVGQLFGPRE